VRIEEKQLQKRRISKIFTIPTTSQKRPMWQPLNKHRNEIGISSKSLTCMNAQFVVQSEKE